MYTSYNRGKKEKQTEKQRYLKNISRVLSHFGQSCCQFTTLGKDSRHTWIFWAELIAAETTLAKQLKLPLAKQLKLPLAKQLKLPLAKQLKLPLAKQLKLPLAKTTIS